MCMQFYKNIDKQMTSVVLHVVRMSSKRVVGRLPAHPPLPVDVRDRLENVQENIHLLTNQLRGGTPVACHEILTPLDVVAKLFQCARGVSDGCTKLAVLFSNPPSPSAGECGMVCGRVEQSLLQLTSTLYQLSPDQGRTLGEEIRDAILRILKGAEKLVLAVIENGCSGKNVKLQGTGTVWESCGAVTKLSKDNRAATLRVFIDQLHLLRDAASEVQELRSNDGLGDDLMDDDDDLLGLSGAVGGMQLGGAVPDHCSATAENGEAEGEEMAREWTPAERGLAEPCLRLIQLSADVTGAVSRLLVSHGSTEQLQFIHELDGAAEIVKKLSPLVDDLAHELPGPVAWKKCQGTAQSLGETLQLFVETSSRCHFCIAAGSRWEGVKFEQTVREALALLTTQ